MYRKYWTILLIVIFIQVQAPVSAAAVPSATDSFIVAPSTTDVVTNYTITVWAADGTNASLGNVRVSLSVTDGIFVSSGGPIVLANTTNGLLVETWTSPAIASLEISRTVTFTAILDQGGSDVSITVDTSVSHETNRAIVNSQTFIPTSLISGLNYELSAQVMDVLGNPVGDISVEYSSVEGNFSDAIGTSAPDGFFNTTYTAPVLDALLPELNFSIDITITASDTISLTLSTNVSTVLTNATSLDLSITSPSTVSNGGSANLVFYATAGGSPAYTGDLSITATDGTFSNGGTTTSATFNVSGYAELTWDAPKVSENVTVSFSYDADYLGTLQATGNFDIDVIFVPIDLILEYNIANDSIKQNVSNAVTVTVKTNDTNQPVSGTPVTLFVDQGFWDESNSETFTTTTNSQGKVTGTYNGSLLILPFETTPVEVTAMVESPEYNLVSTTFNFTLIRVPPVYNYTVDPLSSTIEYGSSINIKLAAKINGLAYVNATFQLIASINVFDGDNTVRDRTDNVGSLVITFDSSKIAKIAEKTTIYITVDLVNSGLATTQISIIITPIEAPNAQVSVSLSEGPSAGTIAGLAVAVVAALGIGSFLILQRRK